MIVRARIKPLRDGLRGEGLNQVGPHYLKMNEVEKRIGN
tara:strand:- start:69 stop:185 length:117 start_codon:yes stop_codon:yes gene_type:complete